VEGDTGKIEVHRMEGHGLETARLSAITKRDSDIGCGIVGAASTFYDASIDVI